MSRPPSSWFKNKCAEVKAGLKGLHADWSEDQLDKKASETLANVWYNKFTPQEQEAVLRAYESESKVRKEFDDHDKKMDELEKQDKQDDETMEAALKMARVAEPETAPKPTDNTDGGPIAIHDGLDRTVAAVTASSHEAKKFVSVPMYKFNYVAAPKFGGKDGDIIIKAIVLEQGLNVNGWRVVAEEFPRVAEQYKAGRQLRLNHDKTVQAVFGKSFDGKVLKGSEVSTYLGKEMEGIDPEGLFVAAEFQANPQDPQVRTNILQGYVETGSIGLDADAFCEKCDKPISMAEGGATTRSCKHLDAPIKLKNVEVKEYSYVAEPAYEHTKAFPSFSAAVTEALKNSSVNIMPQTNTPMSTTEGQKIEVNAAAAKKADAEGTASAEALALAEKLYAKYKEARAEGFAEAEKLYKAGIPEEKKEEQKASVATASKTDQVGVVSNVAATKTATNDLIDRVTQPTKYALEMKPWMKEIFKAAAEHPSTPPEIRNKYKGVWA